MQFLRKFSLFLQQFWLILVALFLALVFLVWFIFLLQNSTKKDQRFLNVLNWTSYIPAEVISEFEERYQIKVNYSTYSSNEELLAKVAASPHTYDVIFPSDYMVSLMAERNLLEPLDLTRFSNLSNLDPAFLAQPYDPDNTFSLPFLLATSVIVYDQNQTAPISSYEDLTRMDLRNSLVLLDDSRIIIGMLLLASGYSMNDTDPAHLEDALSFYEKLRPNIKAFDSDSPKTFFLTDEVAAGVIWNAEAALASSEKPNLVTVYPEEGFALSMDNYTIVNGSPRKDDAYLFIDYLMEDSVSRRIVSAYPYLSSNSAAQFLPTDELSQILARGSYVKNLGADAIKRLDRFWARLKN